MASHGDIAEILSRFPGPVTFYPSCKKWLLIFSGCIVFVAIGYWMIGRGDWMGWPGVIFFGLGGLIALGAMLPGSCALRLDRDGFEASSLFRRSRARWRDVSRFEGVRIPPANFKMVAFDDTNQQSGRMAAANVAVCGHNSGLPDTYGFSPDDLASLMTQWRARALT